MERLRSRRRLCENLAAADSQGLRRWSRRADAGEGSDSEQAQPWAALRRDRSTGSPTSLGDLKFDIFTQRIDTQARMLSIETMLFYGTMNELSDFVASRGADLHLDEAALLL